MTLDSATGLINWLTDEDSPAEAEVLIRAYDPAVDSAHKASRFRSKVEINHHELGSYRKRFMQPRDNCLRCRCRSSTRTAIV